MRPIDHAAITRDLNRILKPQGRPRRAPITLADVRTLEDPSDRVRGSRAVLAANADTLGIYSGEYAARPRWTVGDATPERMAHARAGGVQIATERETTEAGERTELKRKRFISKLESFRSHGVISSEGFAAAQQFRSDVDRALLVGPRQSVSYAPIWIQDSKVRELQPAEASMDFQKRIVAAYAAVAGELHPVLAWIGASSNNDIDVDVLARKYYADLSERVRGDKIKAFIELACAQLAKHYGREHRWKRFAISRAAAEIAKILEIA